MAVADRDLGHLPQALKQLSGHFSCREQSANFSQHYILIKDKLISLIFHNILDNEHKYHDYLNQSN